jgi:hypothetical protein
MNLAKGIFGFLLCTLIVAPACARKPESPAPVVPTPQKSFTYDERIGMASITNDGSCLAVFNASVNPGTKVVLVDQPNSHQVPDTPSVNTATVAERLAKSCSNAIDGPDNNGMSPSFYRIQTDVKEWKANIYVYAILEPPAPIVIRDGKVEGDLDGDGTNESFHLCPSSENLHYQVWTGPPLEGRKRWHRTAYLGYSVTPECTEKDMIEPEG